MPAALTASIYAKIEKVKFWYNPNFLALFAFLVLSFFALKSLLSVSFYTSHDGETHTARIAQYAIALRDGQIPPRFASSLYNGLGSPIFVYIYPLPYFLGALIHFSGFSYATSFRLLMALGFLFTQFFAYLWLKEVFKSEKAAFLGALFYTLVPYRFSLIYVRASISEMLAYTFLPLAFYCFTKLAKKQNLKWTAAGGISLALVLLSQDLVALISIPVLALYVLILVIYGKSKKYALLALASAIWSFAISALVYLPSLFERGYIRFDSIIQDAYPNHFVAFWQLIHSPWGYGFDYPGTVNDQMSFQVGLAHWLILLISIALITYIPLSKIDFFKKIFKRIISLNNKRELILAIFFILVFTLSVFLMLDIPQATYLWKNFKPLHTIDIPWRFLGLTALSISFLAAYCTKFIRSGLFMLLMIVFILIANRNHLRVNEPRVLDNNFFEEYPGTATQYGEFTPSWRQTVTAQDFSPENRVQILSGSGQISNISFSSNRGSFLVNTTADSLVRINKFYYPKVQIFDNNQDISKNMIISNVKSPAASLKEDQTGLMLLPLSKGIHQIKFEYQETGLRMFADLLSLLSLSFALAILIKYVKN